MFFTATAWSQSLIRLENAEKLVEVWVSQVPDLLLEFALELINEVIIFRSYYILKWEHIYTVELIVWYSYHYTVFILTKNLVKIEPSEIKKYLIIGRGG